MCLRCTKRRPCYLLNFYFTVLSYIKKKKNLFLRRRRTPLILLLEILWKASSYQCFHWFATDTLSNFLENSSSGNESVCVPCSTAVCVFQFGSGAKVPGLSPDCPSKPSLASHHRVGSRWEAMESTPGELQLSQAAWSSLEWKSIKYIQHSCPHFQLLIALKNILRPFQIHLWNMMLLLCVRNYPLQVTVISRP